MSEELKQSILVARLKALMLHGYNFKCECDYDDVNDIRRHENKMQMIFDAMKTAERNVINSWVEPEADEIDSQQSSEEDETEDLDYQELRDIASELKLKGRSKMDKAELIVAIKASQGV